MDATHEEWRPVVGWDEIYEVSNHGRVRSKSRYVRSRGSGKRLVPGRIRKLQTHKQGYRMVSLRQDGTQSFRLVHQLVLEAFIGPRPGGMVACHNDGDPTNNHVDNLRWDTQSANLHDAVRHGTHTLANVTECKHGHVYTAESTIIGKNGWRSCRECKNAADRNYSKRMHPGVYPGDRTHCPHGHAYDEENTFVNRKGSRECRTCMRNRSRRRSRDG